MHRIKGYGGRIMSKFKELAKQLWNVPNMFTLIRVFCVPFFLVFLIYGGLKGRQSFIYIALGIFVFASLTDLFDGAIARKFNQVTEVGKVLDPFADKIMHISVVLGLTIIGYVHWAFIVAIAVKELTMVLCGFYLVKHGVIVFANKLGKVASFALSVGVIISFFHPYVFFIDWVVIGIAVILTYAAFVHYGIAALRDFKRIKLEKQMAEITDKKADNDEQNI